jgi:hypothetical protein
MSAAWLKRIYYGQAGAAIENGHHPGLSHLANRDSTRTRSGSVGYLDADAPLWMGSGIPGNMELDRADPSCGRNHTADFDLWLEVGVRFWP